MMQWGKLTTDQLRELRVQASGRVVVDAGSGRPALTGENPPRDARGLADVVYLDKEAYPGVLEVDLEDTHAVIATLAPWLHTKPVLLLSWPISRPSYRFGFVSLFDTVVYVGMNREGTACGNENLFRQFLRRDLLAEVQGWNNDLLVYGPAHPEQRLLRIPAAREERAVLSPSGWGA